ncbi:MAG: C_GCAxxG_C_C family protein [Erysipelotrichaceae bacterium]|nr:C_GCAxxG_C_C family protein [Erysipelotrichaceae bacterium]
MKIGSCFCLGMGSMEGDCGALIAIEMLYGLLRYEGKGQIRESKELYEAFKEKSGSSVCRVLKGTDSGEVLCTCDQCIINAIDILEDKLNKEKQ